MIIEILMVIRIIEFSENNHYSVEKNTWWDNKNTIEEIIVHFLLKLNVF